MMSLAAMIRPTLKDDSSYASQYGILKSRAEAYLDRMQADLLKHDAADMERLYEFGKPSPSVIRARGIRPPGSFCPSSVRPIS
jgi:hypothetical protein